MDIFKLGLRNILGLTMPGVLVVLAFYYTLVRMVILLGLDYNQYSWTEKPQFLVFAVFFLLSYVIGALIRLKAADEVDEKSRKYLLRTYFKEFPRYEEFPGTNVTLEKALYLKKEELSAQITKRRYTDKFIPEDLKIVRRTENLIKRMIIEFLYLMKKEVGTIFSNVNEQIDPKGQRVSVTVSEAKIEVIERTAYQKVGEKKKNPNILENESTAEFIKSTTASKSSKWKILTVIASWYLGSRLQLFLNMFNYIVIIKYLKSKKFNRPERDKTTVNFMTAFDRWIWREEKFPYPIWQLRRINHFHEKEVNDFYEERKHCTADVRGIGEKEFFNSSKIHIVHGSGSIGNTLRDEINREEATVRFFSGAYFALKYSFRFLVFMFIVQLIVILFLGETQLSTYIKADPLVQLGSSQISKKDTPDTLRSQTSSKGANLEPDEVARFQFKKDNVDLYYEMNSPTVSGSHYTIESLWLHMAIAAVLAFSAWKMQRYIIRRFRTLRLREVDAVYDAYYLIRTQPNTIPRAIEKFFEKIFEDYKEGKKEKE